MDALINNPVNAPSLALPINTTCQKRSLALAASQRVIEIWGVHDRALSAAAAEHFCARLSRDPRLVDFLAATAEPSRRELREFALRVARESHNALAGLLCESEEPALWSGASALAARVRESLLRHADELALGPFCACEPAPAEAPASMPPQPLGRLFSPRTLGYAAAVRSWTARARACAPAPFATRA